MTPLRYYALGYIHGLTGLPLSVTAVTGDTVSFQL